MVTIKRRFLVHNLNTVFRFEVIRALKKKTFWITTLSFPLIIAVVFGIVFLSNKTTEDAAKNMSKQQFSIIVNDQTGLVQDTILSQMGIKTTTDKNAAIDQVKTGKIDAFFYFPADLKNGIEIYGKDVGIFNNGRYSAVAEALLQQMVTTKVDQNVRSIVGNQLTINSLTYKDGAVSDPMRQLIAPGLFLVLFYFLIAMFGNQALTSTTEEKENRVIEMLLTTVQARTLIIGKILSLILLAFIQGILFIAPVIIGYFFLHNQLRLPTIDLSSIPLDPARIGVAAVIFAASFILFMGLLVAIGAATPTAKEAGPFLGIVMMLLFGPLYAASLFISSPESPLVQFLSYFPLTAPIPLLLRNAAGTITWPEVFIGTAILIITAVIVIRIAVRIFQFGALEYSRRLSFKEVLVRK